MILSYILNSLYINYDELSLKKNRFNYKLKLKYFKIFFNNKTIS